MATRLAFERKAPCRRCARSTWSATLKAMYVNSMANSATMTPRKPNWARDWIICGSPSVGPWVAWRAMKTVPTRIPAVPATIVHPRDRPSDGPMKPIGMVKYWKLPRNHSGAWCQTLPCRSLSGIQSIERVSTPWMPPPCVRTGALSLVATASSSLVRRMRPGLNNVTVGDAAPRVNSVLHRSCGNLPWAGVSTVSPSAPGSFRPHESPGSAWRPPGSRARRAAGSPRACPARPGASPPGFPRLHGGAFLTRVPGEDLPGAQVPRGQQPPDRAEDLQLRVEPLAGVDLHRAAASCEIAMNGTAKGDLHHREAPLAGPGPQTPPPRAPTTPPNAQPPPPPAPLAPPT